MDVTKPAMPGLGTSETLPVVVTAASISAVSVATIVLASIPVVCDPPVAAVIRVACPGLPPGTPQEPS